MQAVVFANRNGEELMPLNGFYCPALLPVSNKSVIEYTLEDLAEAGVKQVKLVVSNQVSQLKALIGSGERWGLSVDYFLSRDQELASEVLKRMSLDKSQSILLARADILRSPSIKSFVAFSLQMPASLVIAKINNQNAGLMMLPAAADYTSAMNWPLIPSERLIEKTHCDSVTQVLHGDCFMLDSIDNYVQANYSMAIAKVIGSSPQGRFLSAASQGCGFYIGAKTKTGQLRNQHAWGVIGENSWIDESATMQQNIVVGRNCLVDKNCTLKNCIILDDSYVGQNLNVSNAIICNSLLISVNTGGYIKLDDKSLLARNQNSLVDNTEVSASEQSIALVMLVSALLFSPLLFVAALLHNRKQPLYKELVTVDAKTYSSWRLNLGSPFISRLPQLILVVRGKLNLLGCNPFKRSTQTKDNEHKQQSSQVASESNEKIQPLDNSLFNPSPLVLPPEQSAPFGVYGPLQLQDSRSIPEEEQQLIEAEFTQLTIKQQLIKLITTLSPTKSAKHAKTQPHIS
ncbi:sugar phosphate nucleotidyltransferase [Shewanella pneumatophori]|uniref:Translation initiation factor eIF2B subunit gamma n=1 Tax=Shewanella pneumatophori TaxID=314092 RepID=A0A9X2CDS7_9GAMM|nr:NDP-sugar synthase [Shewanella pneumatophori]MCL1139548.1 NDP-sugar synthase [Shewanella pneumatophori]